MEVTRAGIIAALIVAAGAGAAFADDATAVTEEDFNFDHVSCKGAENEIRVIIVGVEDSVGLITADLFPNRQEGFLHGRGRLKQVKYAAKSPMTKFCIDAPESGLFAMSTYHDENANGDFDKTAIGFPAEPWGISNNPKVRFGPPPVEKALFEVTPQDGAHVVIKLN
ncbi:DUF2141 domain-containing protein [Hyphococcus luteus]|uniref:DUF2141 domain-containing protein n=1 Tax=Hyphococcus luteus TaxID=2058213 RepID=A0A2S7K797_9PROT|nr:DUF2141 domain-containing protein [Marinicaulis flavus]PQA88352.1 hypothetical protein CW354_08625 [Marinicaulis flavus]